jgi:hypothetical protein
MKSRQTWAAWLFATLPAAMGIFTIILAFLPYGILKPFTDLLMPDGNFNSLKPWNAEVFRVLFGLGGIILIGLAVLTGLRRWSIIGTFFKQLRTDAGAFFASLRLHKDEFGFLAALLVIMVLAVIYRFEYITSPLHHDEAYTYVAFAHSLFATLTDYHLPNNHVFHTILVYFSTRLFGIQPWAVRLPAFSAGVLLVPAAYWLAKRLYSRWTAIGAALLVAWLPALVGYSTNARGYTLVALFTLLTLALGTIIRKQKNLFAWTMISVFSALGLYTVPVMLFPFGILYAWLFLENLNGSLAVTSQPGSPGQYHSKFDFLKYWLATGFGTAFLTILFYTPILIFTGPEKVFNNGFVAPLHWTGLVETLSHRFSETWFEWSSGVPLFVVGCLMAGWALSLIFHYHLSSTRIPLQMAALLWIVALIIIQRPNAWAKVWLFLLPLMLIWASAGIVGLLEKIRPKFWPGLPLAGLAVGLAMLAGIQHAAWLAPQLPGLWEGHGNEEEAVLFIQGQLRDKDLIIVSAPDDAVVWYYAQIHGIIEAHFDTTLPFDRALIMVDRLQGQTPASVIANRGPDPALIKVESCHLLQTLEKIEVFECQHQ